MAEAMTPKQIVAELDRYIVGQAAAKKAVAVAIRNRWRRQQLPAEMRKDVTPKNIILIGPTGVGKTEIARRLATLVGAPFIKVEATKFTEVGYVGRDVESIIRDLTEAGIGLVRQEMRATVQEKAKEKVTERLLDLLVPMPKNTPWEPEQEKEELERRQRTRDKMKARLDASDLEDRMVELTVEQKASPVQIFSNLGMENMDVDLQGMFDKMIPKNNQPRQLSVKDARRVLLEQETESLIDRAAVVEQAVERVENHGIVFLDEIDKVCGPSSGHGPDVSRQGVQRDLLPVVEGTTVNTKHGPVKTDHILFVAAGAFHTSKPSDLMPELQGRFPIRVELTDLTKADFLRVLTEPKHALPKQYAELMRTEGVELEFTPDGLEALADIAFDVNRSQQNIGARRLHTVIERVVEEVSFDGPDLTDKRVVIDGKFVREKLGPIAQSEDLSKFILCVVRHSVAVFAVTARRRKAEVKRHRHGVSDYSPSLLPFAFDRRDEDRHGMADYSPSPAFSRIALSFAFCASPKGRTGERIGPALRPRSAIASFTALLPVPRLIAMRTPCSRDCAAFAASMSPFANDS